MEALDAFCEDADDLGDDYKAKADRLEARGGDYQEWAELYDEAFTESTESTEAARNMNVPASEADFHEQYIGFVEQGDGWMHLWQGTAAFSTAARTIGTTNA